MEKSQIRVLIVEDDQTLGKALSATIKAAGYFPLLCTNAPEALNQLKIQDVRFVVTDCLLPKMTGVDFAHKVRVELESTVPILFTSGIFKDKNFAKEAIQKVKAVGFLTKPFDIKELIKIIDTTLEDLIDVPVSPLDSILLNPTASPGDKVKAIRESESIHGFDLPWIVMLLTHPTTNGILHLDKNDPKKKAALHFYKGRVVQVEMQNPESFFGALLIERGFLEVDQLDVALKTPSSKRIGERLVEMNFLSPHAIDIINAEQLAMRLSRLVADANYKIEFEEKETPESNCNIDIEGLAPFLADWVISKISLPWLKSRYLHFADLQPQKVQSPANGMRLWQMPLLSRHKNLITSFEKGETLTQVLTRSGAKEEVVYQIFHLMVLAERLRFKKTVRVVDETSMIARLERLEKDMKEQDHFTVLGIQRNVKAADLKRAYHDLAKTFHPDKLSTTASPRLVQLTKSVFATMTMAYETLSNDTKKTVYMKELELGRAEKILAAENLIEEGKVFIKSGQYKKAREKFEETLQLRPATSEVLLHIVWSSLMLQETSADGQTSVEKASETLNKIPPEDRHNAQYYFVKGLLLKNTGDLLQAKKNMQHALSLNPKFTEADRILRVLDLQANQKNTNILTGDLTAVVSGFFKKR